MTRWLTMRDPAGTWRAAALLGLITSLYATLVGSFAAEPLAGRDSALDWMLAGTIPLRAAAITSPPTGQAIVAGVLTYLAAEVGWALAFFGLLGRWTRSMRPGVLLALVLPWAATTSAFEYYVLLPYWQPLLPLEQPYWVGLAVHALSAIGYPLYPWLRARLVLRRDLPGAAFGPGWATALSALAGGVIFLSMLHGMHLDPLWPGVDAVAREDQRTFLRRMTAHHEVGLMLADYAVQRASTAARDGVAGLGLQDVSELMHATQKSEILLMSAFWRSLFGGDIPQVQEHEGKVMPGMVSSATLAAVAGMPDGPPFERAVLKLMVEHHRGAIVIADTAVPRMADPRLKAMATALAHAHRGQIAIMSDLVQRIDSQSDVRTRF